MKKLPKQFIPVVTTAGVIILAIAMYGVMNKSGSSNPKVNSGASSVGTAEITTEQLVADVEPIELPKEAELEENIGFVPKQVESLTDKYVLRMVEYDENKVSYYYQMHLATVGDRLKIVAEPMTEEEYKNTLPTGNFETIEIDGQTLTFTDRTYFYVKDEDSVTDYIKGEVEANRATVELGNTLDELGSIETMSWYTDGIKYQLVAINHDFDIEKMQELAEAHINE